MIFLFFIGFIWWYNTEKKKKEKKNTDIFML